MASILTQTADQDFIADDAGAPLLVLRYHPALAIAGVLGALCLGLATGHTLLALPLALASLWFTRPCGWIFERHLVLRPGWNLIARPVADQSRLRLRDGALWLEDEKLPLHLALLRSSDGAALARRFGRGR